MSSYEDIAKNLMDGKVPPGLESDGSQAAIKGYRALLFWAVDNIDKKPDHIPKSQLPSGTHQEFLRWAQSSQDKFWSEVAKNDLLTQKEGAETKRFEDDCRRLFKLLDKLHEHLKSQQAAQQPTSPIAEV